MNYIEYKYTNSDLTRLLIGRKGGQTTIRIIDQILVHPYNINQLSELLKLDYNTVKYHINLILKLDLVESNGSEYGSLFFPSKKLINNLNEYEQIKKYLNNS